MIKATISGMFHLFFLSVKSRMEDACKITGSIEEEMDDEKELQKWLESYISAYRKCLWWKASNQGYILKPRGWKFCCIAINQKSAFFFSGCVLPHKPSVSGRVFRGRRKGFIFVPKSEVYRLKAASRRHTKGNTTHDYFANTCSRGIFNNLIS